MKIVFDWGELHVAAYERARMEKKDRVYGFYHEEYGLPSIAIDMDAISKDAQPPHVLPGVVDELGFAATFAHELVHYALQYGEANKKAKLTHRQEEIVCNAVATVFSHLFSSEFEKLHRKLLKGGKLDVKSSRHRKSKSKRVDRK